jgi:selenocysteine-specific elongation factor
MHVVATAGHVDHGKSTLVRALTGTDPDRLEEERRRGLTIELGYCWTALPEAGDVAFVDVPGHERFVPTMLSGVGPVPAVLFAVAADDDWMPQAGEHLAAIDALGVGHAVVAVTRSDLADPAPMLRRARTQLAGTTLADAELVAVSAATGAGLPALRAALVRMLAALPTPDPAADVRFWVDRCFSVDGAGTVVTGTLSAGTVAVGDVLTCEGALVRVRGLQTLEHEVAQVHGTARVAMRLGGGAPAGLRRGGVLLTPDAWCLTDVVDVRTTAGPVPPRRPVLHVGATHVEVRHRPLDDRHSRLTLRRPLPLRVGDRVLLRDPGAGRIHGAVVLDPRPPALDRRGTARERASTLAQSPEVPDVADELRRRVVVAETTMRRLGVPTTTADALALRADGWLLDAGARPALTARLRNALDSHLRADPLARGLPVPAATHALSLPTKGFVPLLLGDDLAVADGIVVRRTEEPPLPPDLEQALRRLHDDLVDAPFRAPEAARLADLGLHRRAVAAAERAGRLLRLADGIVLLPGADRRAADRLRDLPQPFTAAQARTCLGTTRRVVLPLLAYLDARGVTERLPDDRRRLRHTS